MEEAQGEHQNPRYPLAHGLELQTTTASAKGETPLRQSSG